MRALLLATGILGFVIATSVPAGAQPMGARIAKEVIETSEQLETAMNAVEEALKTYLTKGESARGATGAIGELLLKSEDLICNMWMITFERVMSDLSTGGALNSDEGTALVQALNRLRSRIEEECDKAINGRRRIGVIRSGEGDLEGGSGLVPNTCPNCPYERQALADAEARLELAQWRAARARARTTYLAHLWAANHKAMTQLGEETVEESQQVEQRRSREVTEAQAAVNTARAALIKCTEACHKQLRDQYGFFDRNKKVLITAAAAAIASVALVGGGGTPTALVSQPSPPPVVNTAPTANTTPVVSSPTPAPPTLLSLIVGRWICTACRPVNDPDRHENTLRFCVQLIAAFQLLANSPLRIEHPAPWVAVSGELDEASGTYRATGQGPVSGFSNVSSTVAATFQRSGDTVNAVDLTVTLGENGVFPGGRPVTYSVRLTKTP